MTKKSKKFSEEESISSEGAGEQTAYGSMPNPEIVNQEDTLETAQEMGIYSNSDEEHPAILNTKEVINVADQQNRVNPIQVEKYLGGIDYPTNKESLIEKAKEAGADDSIINALEQMLGDTFESPTDVTQALGRLD